MNLEINQLLHGYSGGHRLLESSRKVSQDAQRKLLLLSDLSGPSPLPGFDSYLTGYWIESDGLFAFARTWYAPEMERPGCVWTHTLLLEPSVFQTLQRPSELSTLFRRPTSADFGEYARPVQLIHASPNIGAHSSLESLRRQLRRILAALYGQPERAVICPTSSAERADVLVMWIWNHQTRDLQKHFQFSTGSLANRNRDSFEFDLQFMPVRSAQVRHRAAAGAEIVIDEDDVPLMASELRAGIDELIDSSDHVTKFLSVIDADLPGSRRALATALELHSRVSHAGPVAPGDTSTLSLISEAFPNPLEATALKKWLLDALLATRASPHGLAELAKSLVAAPDVSASFASVEAAVARVVGRIVSTDLSVAVRLADEVLTNASPDAVERFVKTFANYINEDNVGAIANTSSTVLAACVRAKPSMLRLKELWCTEPSTAHAIARIVNDITVVPETLLLECVEPFLTGCSANAAMTVGQPLGRLVAPVLTKLQSGQVEARGLHVIEGLLAEHQQAAAEWCANHDFSYQTFEVIANNASPTPDWKRVPPERWRFIIRSASTTAWTSSRGLVAAAFLFAIVLDADSGAEGIYDVVPSTFEPIHDAAETDSLPYKAWEVLRPRLPLLSWFHNWDICEQLRRALVDKWLATEWPVRPLMAAAKNPDTFKRIVDYCTDAYDRRYLLRRMVAEIGERPEAATEDQRWILQRAHVV